MTFRTLAALLVVATSTLAACSGGGNTASFPIFVTPSPSSAPTPTPAPTLIASPQAIQFSIFPPVPSPQPVVLSGSALSSGLPIDVSIADPTKFGVTPVVFVQAGPPTYAIYAIANGTTAVTFTTGSASAVVTLNSGLCGRPDSIAQAQLISPRPGATGVPANGTTVYFMVTLATGAAPQIYLHLIAGAHATIDQLVPLQIAAPPPGAATPTPPPIPNTSSYVMSVAAPSMPAGATIRTQLYDDSCQPAVLAGSFST